jgi:hypothetical protein
MQIHFERAGGFVPSAMKRSYVINSDNLSAEDADELQKLIAQADIASLAGRMRASAPRPDVLYYRLIIDDTDGSRTVTASDADMPATLRPLIDWLTERATQSR